MDLDQPNAYAEVDESDFLAKVEAFPEQLEQAAQLAGPVDLGPVQNSTFQSIAVLGVGGSGIAGDVLEAVLESRTKLWTKTSRSSALPGWVNEKTLVFAVSYSGGTAEVLAAADQAFERGAPVVAITSGGRLARIAESKGAPVVRLPGGFQPRAALGFLSFPMFEICSLLGIADLKNDMYEAIELTKQRAEQWSRQCATQSNVAKQLAGRLAGLTPLIYGAAGVAEVAAYRWKCEFNECAKIHAFSNFFPELAHNEIAAWTGKEHGRHQLAHILLRSSQEPPEQKRQIAAVTETLKQGPRPPEVIETDAKTPAGRFFDLAYLGDFAATYLAIASNLDPTPIDAIQRLKNQIAAPEETASS